MDRIVIGFQARTLEFEASELTDDWLGNQSAYGAREPYKTRELLREPEF